MAAVTLKDLMDPLSKIAAASEQTNEKLDALIAVSTGASGGGGLELAIVTQLEAQTEYLKIIADNTQKGGMGGMFRGARKDKKDVATAGRTLDLLGVGAKKTATGMLLWTLVPKKTITKFTMFVADTFEALASQDTKKVKQGIDVLALMGDAILKFSGALALSAILLIPGMIAIPFLIGSIALMGGAMYLLGTQAKLIRKGARTLDRMGDAIFSFGVGMAAFAITTFFIIKQPAILLGMVMSLVLIGGAVALLGMKKVSKNVRRGSLNLIIMGAAVGIFGIGYGIFAAAFPSDVGFKDVLIQAAAIAGIGIATAIVGKFGLSNILQGALSLAVNGIGLLVFNLGYVPFAEATKGMKFNDILIQSGVLLAIGTVMALAGLAVAATAGAALLGPALFAAAGGSLLLLAPGLQAMKDLDYSEQDSKDLATTLGAVAMAFSGVDPEAGAFGMLKGLFTRVVQSGSGLAAAAMYGGAGLALQELSKGLTAFKDVGFTEDDSKELAIALGSVSGAFAQAGGEPASPGGLFGAVFGNTFSPNATERGIESVMDSGEALMSIVDGLASFLDLKKKYGLDGDAFKKDGYLNTAITETLGFLNSAFAAIGSNETSDSALFGLFQWDENNVEKGIDAVKGSGKALKDITDGLAAFLDLRKKYGLTEEAFKSDGFLAIAVKDSLGFVSKAFATIGGMEVEDGWGPFSWDENLVEKGVDAVKGAGQELTNIAEGLKSFQAMVEQDIDFDADGDLAKAVTNSLTFVAEAFKTIGGMEEKDSWFVFSWDENLVEKGVEAVQGAGAELTNIANGLMTFQGLIEKNVDFKAGGTLANAVKNTLTFVGDAFMSIAAKKKTKSTFFGLISWDENQVAEGIENVKGAGAELEKIAKGIEIFAGIENPAKIAKGITSLFNNIADAFTAQYTRYSLRGELDHFGRWVNDLADAAGSGDLAKAGTDLEKIAAAINSVDIYKAESMAALFSGASELGRNRLAYRALYEAVEDIRDLLSEQTGGGAAAGGAEGGGEGAPAAGGNSNSGAMKRLNSTLGRLERTMSSLPASIQSIKIVVPE